MKQTIFFRDFTKDEKWVLILSSVLCLSSGFGFIRGFIPDPWGVVVAAIGVGLLAYYYRYLFIYKHYIVYNRVGANMRINGKIPGKDIRFDKVKSVEQQGEELIVQYDRQSTAFQLEGIAEEDVQKVMTILKHRKLH